MGFFYEVSEKIPTTKTMSREIEELNDSIEAVIADMESLQARIETLGRGSMRSRLIRLQRRKSNLLDTLLEELAELESDSHDAEGSH